jgi:hypothetical protein
MRTGIQPDFHCAASRAEKSISLHCPSFRRDYWASGDHLLPATCRPRQMVLPYCLISGYLCYD